MGLKRYYVQGPVPDEFEVTGSEYNHMANVMRARAGDRVIVCNGDGTDRLCEIVLVEKPFVRLKVLERTRNEQEADLDVTAFVGLLKGDNTELAVQKLSELGVRRAVPFVSENTVARADAKKIERLNRVALESAKQCGRASCLLCEPAVDFSGVLARVPAFDRVLFCYECERERGIAEAAAGLKGRVAVVVGSEGGFTPAEAEAARRAGCDVVSLGRRILRAETATIAAAAVVMFSAGELGGRP